MAMGNMLINQSDLVCSAARTCVKRKSSSKNDFSNFFFLMMISGSFYYRFDLALIFACFVLMYFLTDDMANNEDTNLCTQAYNWFCGYNAIQATLTDKEKEEKERKITSIEQNKLAKVVLETLLVIVCAIGIFILAFFSVPT